MAHLSKSPFLEKKRIEKGENLGFFKRSSLGWVCFHLFLLRDQTTWKRRFEEVEVRNKPKPLCSCV